MIALIAPTKLLFRFLGQTISFPFAQLPGSPSPTVSFAGKKVSSTSHALMVEYQNGVNWKISRSNLTMTEQQYQTLLSLYHNHNHNEAFITLATHIKDAFYDLLYDRKGFIPFPTPTNPTTKDLQ